MTKKKNSETGFFYGFLILWGNDGATLKNKKRKPLQIKSLRFFLWPRQGSNLQPSESKSDILSS